MSLDRRPASQLLAGVLAAVVATACTSGASPSVAPPSVAPSVPPSAAASGGGDQMTIVAKGDLKPVDGTASGLAELVTLPDGSYEVVLEDFSIGSTAHTNVILVANDEVTQTGDIDKAKILDLGPLAGTSGMQTYAIPADMAGQVMEGYHSVVIWDTEMAHAIAAASLS